MWWREILRTWKENLGSADIVLYNKTLNVFKNFIQVLKSQSISEEILCLYFTTIRFCQIQSYIKAHDFYLKLSASNSFVNLLQTDSAKYPSQSFRKCTQTFKRMISLAQKFFPNDPSKSVNI